MTEKELVLEVKWIGPFQKSKKNKEPEIKRETSFLRKQEQIKTTQEYIFSISQTLWIIKKLPLLPVLFLPRISSHPFGFTIAAV